MRCLLGKCLVICLVLVAICSCNGNYTPKPYGYFRIQLPEKKYSRVGDDLPFSFELPSYARLELDTNKNAEKYWVNIQFPRFHSTIHVSYKAIKGNINEVIDDSHRMAYKHSVKADAIKEIGLFMPEKRVFGLMYDIKGDAASSIQFTVTDSVHHFVRGALYFNSIPNKDSLAPVIQFIRADVQRIMETLEWQSK